MGTGSFGNVELGQSNSNTAPPQGERPDLKASASAAGPPDDLSRAGFEGRRISVYPFSKCHFLSGHHLLGTRVVVQRAEQKNREGMG